MSQLSNHSRKIRRKIYDSEYFFPSWEDKKMQKKANLELVKQNISKANGLPNEHYIDQSIFDEEKNSILFNQWAGLDVCAEVPEIGDSKPIDFMGLPLFIIRDTQNVVRVFQNTCRHRGMILFEKNKNGLEIDLEMSF